MDDRPAREAGSFALPKIHEIGLQAQGAEVDDASGRIPNPCRIPSEPRPVLPAQWGFDASRPCALPPSLDFGLISCRRG